MRVATICANDAQGVRHISGARGTTPESALDRAVRRFHCRCMPTRTMLDLERLRALAMARITGSAPRASTHHEGVEGATLSLRRTG